MSEIEQKPVLQPSNIKDAVLKLNDTAAELVMNQMKIALTGILTKTMDPLLNTLEQSLGSTPSETAMRINRIVNALTDEEVQAEIKVLQKKIFDILSEAIDESMEQFEPIFDKLESRLTRSALSIIRSLSRLATEAVDSVLAPIPPLALLKNILDVVNANVNIFKQMLAIVPTMLESVNIGLELVIGKQIKLLEMKGDILNISGRIAEKINMVTSLVDSANNSLTQAKSAVNSVNPQGMVSDKLAAAKSAVNVGSFGAESLPSMSYPMDSSKLTQAIPTKSPIQTDDVINKTAAVTDIPLPKTKAQRNR